MRNPSAGGLSAAQIRNGELEALGERIAAHLRKMRNYEARAQEKAGVELKKGDNHWNSVTQLLVEARKQCDGGGFKAFKERYCPDLSRSRIYELLAIGDGKKTLEETRAGKRERVATSRRKESATTAVADKPAGKQPAQDPEDHTERGEDHGDRGAIERLRKDKGKLESEILGLHIEAVKLQQQCTALRDQREDLQFQTFIKAIEAALTFADAGTHWTLQQLNAE